MENKLIEREKVSEIADNVNRLIEKNKQLHNTNKKLFRVCLKHLKTNSWNLGREHAIKHKKERVELIKCLEEITKNE